MPASPPSTTSQPANPSDVEANLSAQQQAQRWQLYWERRARRTRLYITGCVAIYLSLGHTAWLVLQSDFSIFSAWVVPFVVSMYHAEECVAFRADQNVDGHLPDDHLAAVDDSNT
jgi:hypothetical protein